MNTVGEVTLYRRGKEWRVPVAEGLFVPAMVDELFPGDEVDFGDLPFPWLDVKITKRVPAEWDNAFTAASPRPTEPIRIEVNAECHSCHRVARHRLAVLKDAAVRRCIIKGCNGEWKFG